MRKVSYLVALSMLATLVFATTATAQNTACDDVRERLNAGNSGLTPAELLACGLSPEAIDPCEGNPNPSCRGANGPPISIGGPNGVGRVNECSDLPQGSPEAVACFEQLIANRAEGQQPQPKMDEQPKMEEKMEMKTEEKGKEKEEKKEMPKTGGPAVGSFLALGAGALLVGGGLIVLRRRNS